MTKVLVVTEMRDASFVHGDLGLLKQDFKVQLHGWGNFHPDCAVVYMATPGTLRTIRWLRDLEVPYLVYTGGCDVADYPFGKNQKPRQRAKIREAIEGARTVLTFGDPVETMMLADCEPIPLRPYINTRLHHPPNIIPLKRKGAVTVCATVNHFTACQKGLRRFGQFCKDNGLTGTIACRSFDRATADELGSRFPVTLRLGLTDYELRDLYRSCEAYGHFSQHEGYGIASVEAAINGCPVVMSPEAAAKSPLMPDQRRAVRMILNDDRDRDFVEFVKALC